MPVRAGLQLIQRAALALLLFGALSCDSSQRCSGPGTCSAGEVCIDSICADPAPPGPDASAPRDSGSQSLDVAPVTPQRDASSVDNGVPPASDTGRVRDTYQVMDLGALPPSGLGSECVVPDFSLGEMDPCGFSDPNLYCLERVDGNGAYCTKACVIEAPLDGHHGGIDIGWHPHPDPCDEIGCCVPLEPGIDAGPFMPIDRVCRFRSDCN